MLVLQPHQTKSPTYCYEPGDKVVDAQLSADGSRLMARCENGSVHLWNAETGKALIALGSDTVKAVQSLFSPSGAHLLIITNTAIAQVFDAESATELGRFDAHQHDITAASFLKDESGIITASADGVIFIWQPIDNAPVIALTGQYGSPITAIDVSSDSNKVATVSHPGRSIVVWDTRTGEPIAFDKRIEENRPVQAVFDPSGSHLIVPTIHGFGETRVHEFGSVPLVDLFEAQHSLLYSLPGMEGRDPVPILTDVQPLDSEWGREALFSPDGRTLAVRQQDSDIILWDWASREKLRTLRHGDELITRMSFSPDSRYLLVAPGEPENIIPDGSKWDAQIARVWDLVHGSEALVLQGHVDLVMSAVFDAKGEKIVTASKDGTVLVWSADPAFQDPSGADAGGTPVVSSLRADAAALEGSNS
jgi:WD40 repeat protein